MDLTSIMSSADIFAEHIMEQAEWNKGKNILKEKLRKYYTNIYKPKCKKDRPSKPMPAVAVIFWVSTAVLSSNNYESSGGPFSTKITTIIATVITAKITVVIMTEIKIEITNEIPIIIPVVIMTVITVKNGPPELS